DFEHLRRERAGSAGKPVEDLMPRSLLAFEKRAEETGRGVNELIAEIRERLAHSTYPGPDCLEPFEVEHYLQGRLSQHRIDHSKGCDGCAALLRGAAPV